MCGMTMFHPEENIQEIYWSQGSLERYLLLALSFPVLCAPVLLYESHLLRTTLPTVVTRTFTPHLFLQGHCKGRDGRVELCPFPPHQEKQGCLDHSG
jgi:hypothetical protein